MGSGAITFNPLDKNVVVFDLDETTGSWGFASMAYELWISCGMKADDLQDAFVNQYMYPGGARPGLKLLLRTLEEMKNQGRIDSMAVFTSASNQRGWVDFLTKCMERYAETPGLFDTIVARENSPKIKGSMRTMKDLSVLSANRDRVVIVDDVTENVRNGYAIAVPKYDQSLHNHNFLQWILWKLPGHGDTIMQNYQKDLDRYPFRDVDLSSDRALEGVLKQLEEVFPDDGNWVQENRTLNAKTSEESSDPTGVEHSPARGKTGSQGKMQQIYASLAKNSEGVAPFFTFAKSASQCYTREQVETNWYPRAADFLVTVFDALLTHVTFEPHPEKFAAVCCKNPFVTAKHLLCLLRVCNKCANVPFKTPPQYFDLDKWKGTSTAEERKQLLEAAGFTYDGRVEAYLETEGTSVHEKRVLVFAILESLQGNELYGQGNHLASQLYQTESACGRKSRQVVQGTRPYLIDMKTGDSKNINPSYSQQPTLPEEAYTFFDVQPPEGRVKQPQKVPYYQRVNPCDTTQRDLPNSGHAASTCVTLQQLVELPFIRSCSEEFEPADTRSEAQLDPAIELPQRCPYVVQLTANMDVTVTDVKMHTVPEKFPELKGSFGAFRLKGKWVQHDMLGSGWFFGAKNVTNVLNLIEGLSCLRDPEGKLPYPPNAECFCNFKDREEGRTVFEQR